MEPARDPAPTSAVPPPLAPVLMMAFWALLGAPAGVKTTQGVWHLIGWTYGDVAIAVPVGAAVGAVGGALLGLITRPTLMVMLMAVFAGASAGGVAGGIAWGGVGQMGGQVTGGLIGAAAWAVWIYVDRRRTPGPVLPALSPLASAAARRPPAASRL